MAKKVLVIYERKNVLTINTGKAPLRLVPGANRVDAEAWAAARGDKKVAKHIEDGVIVEEKQGTADSLESLKPAEAKKLIKNTIDIETLEIWKLAERRADVVKAIDAQVEALNKELPKKEDENDGDKE